MNDIENQIRELETELLAPQVRRDVDALVELIADDFCEFGSSGRVFDKAMTITALQSEPPRQIDIHEFRVSVLAEGVVLATYKTLSGGQRVLRSSVWVRRNGRWQIVFHQGTMAEGR